MLNLLIAALALGYAYLTQDYLTAGLGLTLAIIGFTDSFLPVVLLGTATLAVGLFKLWSIFLHSDIQQLGDQVALIALPFMLAVFIRASSGFR